jgi:hypothetical protein
MASLLTSGNSLVPLLFHRQKQVIVEKTLCFCTYLIIQGEMLPVERIVTALCSSLLENSL